MKLSKVLFLFALLSMSLLAGNKVMGMRSASALDIAPSDSDEAWEEWDDVLMRSDETSAMAVETTVPSSTQSSEPITQTTSSSDETPAAVTTTVPSPTQPGEPITTSSPAVAPSATPVDESAAPARCVQGAVCYKDQDCGEDNPNSFCAGNSLLGTCRCSACLTGLPCNDDADCGGLRHACLPPTDLQQTRVCNCRAALKENGFPSYVKALTTFCNHRECDGEKDVCLGLPCRSGVCVCPA